MMRGWQPTLVVNGEARAARRRARELELLRHDGRPPRARAAASPTADDRPRRWRVLLLSDGLWRRRFGADPSIVGRTITMNDRQYRVIGVMPAAFEPLDAIGYYGVAAEMWAPIGYEVGGDSACRSCQHLRGFGRLKPGVTIASGDGGDERHPRADAARASAGLRGRFDRHRPAA